MAPWKLIDLVLKSSISFLRMSRERISNFIFKESFEGDEDVSSFIFCKIESLIVEADDAKDPSEINGEIFFFKGKNCSYSKRCIVF